jgi:DNA-binding response OmpR family regulator
MAKVLIIEDERQLAHSLRDWLYMEGHAAHCAYMASEAFDVLRQTEFDLIMLDISLPDLNGLEFCQTYRQNGGAARILIITGRATIEDKEKGLDAGADDYIIKPFDLKEVSARIRALMRRSLSVVGSQIVIGNLVLDLTTQSVTRNDKSIKLLPQEFALLEFLMRNRNRLFSANELIKKLWNGQSSPETVRTHIKTLRKKIDLPGEVPLIQTMRGLGYSVSESRVS